MNVYFKQVRNKTYITIIKISFSFEPKIIQSISTPYYMK